MATKAATQEFVPIESVRDGVVRLKNGEFRAILMTNSVNLSLKSADEQAAILMQFQSFLNSLDFSIQIFAQSRRLDIAEYIQLLEKREGEVREDLLKVQIKEYIEFIKRFTSEANIMTKHFFVVIPYFPTAQFSAKQAATVLPFGAAPNGSAESGAKISFEQARSQLQQRVAAVSQGLSRTGVRSVRLDTEEVIELFYRQFNPGENAAPTLPTTAK